VGAAFAVELTFLNGRAKLPGIDVFSLINTTSKYHGDPQGIFGALRAKRRSLRWCRLILL